MTLADRIEAPVQQLGGARVVTPGGVQLTDFDGKPIVRQVQRVTWDPIMAEKGGFKHFMLKEIYEQPRAIANTLQERVANGRLLEAAFGPSATGVFRRARNVHIVACGTSFHAAAVARYFIEQIGKLKDRLDKPKPAH